MAKVIMISRAFLKGHPRAGEPTDFVEKIMAGLADRDWTFAIPKDFTLYDFHKYYNCTASKGHTIRKGKRFKAGDMASLKVWTGKPYRSKQFEFALVEVKKTWDIEIAIEIGAIRINDGEWIFDETVLKRLSRNDGLSYDDFKAWFPNHFKGQIICWNESINY